MEFLLDGKYRFMREIKVIYEDNHLIAVYKPAGILVQRDRSDEPSLIEEVKEYLKEKYKKEGNVFLGLIHRLDRNVSGVILFAKTSKGASRLSEQFRNREVEKIYHAWVSPAPRIGSATLIHYLSKDENKNFTTVHEKKEMGGDEAGLSYRVENSDDDLALLEIRLGTGRSHQIRAQLSHIGSPIVGDIKYGSKWKMPDQEILLRATSLEFKKATSEEKIKVETESPEKPMIEIVRY